MGLMVLRLGQNLAQKISSLSPIHKNPKKITEEYKVMVEYLQVFVQVNINVLRMCRGQERREGRSYKEIHLDKKV